MRLTDRIRALEHRIEDLQAEVRRVAARPRRSATKGNHDMDMNKLTEKAQEAIAAAQRDAETAPQHPARARALAQALVDQEAGVVPALLDKLGVPPSQVKQRHRAADGRFCARRRAAAGLRVAALSARSSTSAQQEAEQLKDDFVSTEHFLLAMARRADPARARHHPRQRAAGAAGGARRPARHLADPRNHLSVAGEIRARPDQSWRAAASSTR